MINGEDLFDNYGSYEEVVTYMLKAQRDLHECRASIARIEATLERYDEARDEPWDDTHECAPEDRWRLYRDLYAILRGEP